MKLLTTLAVLLTGATQASAANLRNWECADGISINYMYTAAGKQQEQKTERASFSKLEGIASFLRQLMAVRPLPS